MNIRSFISIFLSILFVILSIHILDHLEEKDNLKIQKEWNKIPVKKKPKILKWKNHFYDNYKRKDIINSLNISKLYSQKSTQKNIILFKEAKILQPQKSYLDKFLQYFWRLNYNPGDMSVAHRGIAKSCSSCHNYLNNNYKEKCLLCHNNLKQDEINKNSYHYNVRAKDCTQCHKEHAGLETNYVSFKDFNHDDTNYKLEGYHKKADCYFCHREAEAHKPNEIFSLNAIPRKFMRFQIKGNYNDCRLCHPDLHYPSYGKDCLSCHPINLHWYQ